MTNNLKEIQNEIKMVLQDKIIPFWLERSVDDTYGGYLTDFDENGNLIGNGTKYIVTQSRMLWGFSHLKAYAKPEDVAKMELAAKQGFEFFIEKFWDKENLGFYWQLNRDGTIADSSKLVYGESFAIYALSEYYLVYKDPRALDYADKTFQLLQTYTADTLNGGYYENIENDWSISPAGAYAGDRKSLDIHMHLMEAFTTLYQASGKEIHKRKLLESINIILTHMVDSEIGYGFNQFDIKFNSIPAIDILRTWNAERETNETVSQPTNTTSYGHNVELSWLMDYAYKIIDNGDSRPTVLQKLLDHALAHGYDYEFGGVYRDGIADQEAIVTDKEWWQNFESLVGFINGYARYKDEKYFDAFTGTWNFVKNNFMTMDVGESKQLLQRDGTAIVANVGNSWKGIYHTGRALAECLDRFDEIL